MVAQKAASAFKIPKRTARLVFSGDYEGAEVVVRLNVSVGMFLEIQELLAGDGQSPLKVFELFGKNVLEEWNLHGDDGISHPATGEGMNEIPIALANLLLAQWMEVATKVPDPLGEE